MNNNAIYNTQGDIKRTSLCKCGRKAEFIKDYWVTENKVLKEKDNDYVHTRYLEGV